MKIYECDQNMKLICRFRGHHFHLFREPSDRYSFGNWYMIVKTDAGQTACDGWIDDSSGYTAKTAMMHACEGALIDPPKRWPSQLISASAHHP